MNRFLNEGKFKFGTSEKKTWSGIRPFWKFQNLPTDEKIGRKLKFLEELWKRGASYKSKRLRLIQTMTQSYYNYNVCFYKFDTIATQLVQF